MMLDSVDLPTIDAISEFLACNEVELEAPLDMAELEERFLRYLGPRGHADESDDSDAELHCERRANELDAESSKSSSSDEEIESQ